MGGWTNVHDVERSGRPSVMCHDFFQNVDQQICDRRRFIVSELSCELPQISSSLFYEIIRVTLGYHKFFVSWIQKLLTDAHKMQRLASALTFLEWWHKGGDEFLNHIGRVTGDETWVPFVNVETKEQSKEWIHTLLRNKTKKFKQTSSACQKADGNCLLGRDT
jgi:hypothetical protein